MTETPDEKRARFLADYDHCHTPDGSFIPDLSAAQDGNDVTGCCGRTVPAETPLTSAQPWKHAIGCMNYRPFPTSIAALQEA